MLWINIKRVIKSGFFGFWRNGFVSLSSLLVMIATLSVITSMVIIGAFLNFSILQIKDKVDINVYFTTDAEESDIIALEKRIKSLPEVSDVTYISSERALAEFKTRHANDQFTIQALDVLDENPLGAILNINSKNPSNYESIANFLEQNNASKDGIGIVEKINYNQNKATIERLTRIMSATENLGLIIAGALVLISIIITFNTIRLAIYISKEEINVMRLVGASNFYIRGPFVITGVMSGVLASIITLVVFYPVTYWFGGEAQKFFIGFNSFSYYIKNFGQIFAIVLGAGIMIGALSSYLSVRRYLK